MVSDDIEITSVRVNKTPVWSWNQTGIHPDKRTAGDDGQLMGIIFPLRNRLACVY